MSNVRRVYVEKKPQYAVAAKKLAAEIRDYLGIKSVTGVRVLIRYDVENVSEETYRKALQTVFSEPPVDDIHEETFDARGAKVFTSQFLPGQFDQRADSAEQCVKLLHAEEKPVIQTAVTYVLEGAVTEEELQRVIHHCINPVDSRLAEEEKPETLITNYEEPADVAILDGFTTMDEAAFRKLYDSLGLAMTMKDFEHIRRYFREEEKRDPSMTEIRVLDTYWSDHCRHTTFSTELKNITFEDGYYNKPITDSYQHYLDTMKDMYKDRPEKYVCLMDIALMGMKKLKAEGKLQDQEESDEINACSIVVPVEVDGVTEEWLVSFKNETHNHPTEIEPFGGAATCLGGAIRDPLSGRSYVYQAMRVTGAADPTRPLSETMEGKLPQKKIVTEAAAGYSSYGNQIGLATGYVKEIYHPNYVAKRMEVGAVMGASPRRCVKRLTSDPGDVIILLGGRTGRDGCGGATGSSKAHTQESLTSCGAEVQKGNPPTERKIQRLFRREEVASLIKKCNDFGAGGVSVAIGELADGLQIDLDKVPKKYEGLDGTELAISESQERMAVVIDPKDVDAFLAYAEEENLEAVKVAVVTEEPRLVLNWRGKDIVNLSRAFLDTNGAHQETDVYVEMPDEKANFFAAEEIEDVKETWLNTLSDLNVCSQKGLVERFDSSIGAGSVLMPYGGRYQLTETQSMVAKLPVLKGKCDTVTMMSYGFDPYLSSWSPYHGAIYAVMESISRIVAAGGDYKKIRFSFQEFFRRMTSDPKRYSQPVAALLGAYEAQVGFGLPSIGGKDSMSGTFQDIDVPPTLISFAVDVAKQQDIITPELKSAGNGLVLFRVKKDEYDVPVFEQVKQVYDTVHKFIGAGNIVSAYALDEHGLCAALSKMAFGNKLGVTIYDEVAGETVFGPGFGNIVAEVPEDKLDEVLDSGMAVLVGEVNDEQMFYFEDAEITMEEALAAWSKTLEPVFPSRASQERTVVDTDDYQTKEIYVCKQKVATPHVFIPVFPGTNCEFDSAKAFERAGATATNMVFKNRNEQDIKESVEAFRKEIAKAQIVMLPGGFSAGDEPDGSAKFFATAFRNEVLKDEIHKLLNERDGLVLGICNGFQALVKLGLVPYGEIRTQTEDAPTLTYNTIGRHISKMVYTRVVSNKSPWLQMAELGKTYAIPASHGEGRFVAPESCLKELFANGQVATQYVNEQGQTTMDEEWNVNGSFMAIEGITSPDGRVFGKMAHAERRGDHVALNIYGDQDMKIFESGVAYFK
ncbi:MAG: phosphoribosylformylglycinamidine synthase [Lachnospiraceae bacterium]